MALIVHLTIFYKGRYVVEHFIEVRVFILDHPTDIEFEEVQLEVAFDLNENSYDITQYFINDGPLSPEEFNDLKKNNPSLNKRIERAIDNYVSNYEPEYEEYL